MPRVIHTMDLTVCRLLVAYWGFFGTVRDTSMAMFIIYGTVGDMSMAMFIIYGTVRDTSMAMFIIYGTVRDTSMAMFIIHRPTTWFRRHKFAGRFGKVL